MQGLIIKDHISQETLLSGLSAFFAKRNLSVAYLDISMIQVDDVLLEASPLKGDACINLCIYSRATFDMEELSVFICGFFDTSVLISDNEMNPYSWILIAKDGSKKTIYQTAEENGLFLIR